MTPSRPSPRPRPTRAYTLIEVLIAMGILAMAIGAASRLSLTQSITEELNAKETIAVNYGECAARLWQLGIDSPSSILLSVPNSDRSLMALTIDSNPATTTIDAPATINGGEDNSVSATSVDGTTIMIDWEPTGATVNTRLLFPVIRPKADRR